LFEQSNQISNLKSIEKDLYIVPHASNSRAISLDVLQSPA